MLARPYESYWVGDLLQLLEKTTASKNLLEIRKELVMRSFKFFNRISTSTILQICQEALGENPKDITFNYALAYHEKNNASQIELLKMVVDLPPNNYEESKLILEAISLLSSKLDKQKNTLEYFSLQLKSLMIPHLPDKKLIDLRNDVYILFPWNDSFLPLGRYKEKHNAVRTKNGNKLHTEGRFVGGYILFLLILLDNPAPKNSSWFRFLPPDDQKYILSMDNKKILNDLDKQDSLINKLAMKVLYDNPLCFHYFADLWFKKKILSKEVYVKLLLLGSNAKAKKEHGEKYVQILNDLHDLSHYSLFKLYLGERNYIKALEHLSEISSSFADYEMQDLSNLPIETADKINFIIFNNLKSGKHFYALYFLRNIHKLKHYTKEVVEFFKEFDPKHRNIEAINFKRQAYEKLLKKDLPFELAQEITELNSKITADIVLLGYFKHIEDMYTHFIRDFNLGGEYHHFLEFLQKINRELAGLEKIIGTHLHIYQVYFNSLNDRVSKLKNLTHPDFKQVLSEVEKILSMVKVQLPLAENLNNEIINEDKILDSLFSLEYEKNHFIASYDQKLKKGFYHCAEMLLKNSFLSIDSEDALYYIYLTLLLTGKKFEAFHISQEFYSHFKYLSEYRGSIADLISKDNALGVVFRHLILIDADKFFDYIFFLYKEKQINDQVYVSLLNFFIEQDEDSRFNDKIIRNLPWAYYQLFLYYLTSEAGLPDKSMALSYLDKILSEYDYTKHHVLGLHIIKDNEFADEVKIKIFNSLAEKSEFYFAKSFINEINDINNYLSKADSQSRNRLLENIKNFIEGCKNEPPILFQGLIPKLEEILSEFSESLEKRSSEQVQEIYPTIISDGSNLTTEVSQSTIKFSSTITISQTLKTPTAPPYQTFIIDRSVEKTLEELGGEYAKSFNTKFPVLIPEKTEEQDKTPLVEPELDIKIEQELKSKPDIKLVEKIELEQNIKSEEELKSASPVKPVENIKSEQVEATKSDLISPVSSFKPLVISPKKELDTSFQKGKKAEFA